MSQYNSNPISQFPSGLVVLPTDEYLATDVTNIAPTHPTGYTNKYTIAQLAAYIETFIGGFSWVTITGITENAVINTGYFPANIATTTILLPPAMPAGSIIRVVGTGSCNWTFQANAGQIIQLGTVASSTGGTVSSSSPTDALELVCSTNNTVWSYASGQTLGYNYT